MAIDSLVSQAYLLKEEAWTLSSGLKGRVGTVQRQLLSDMAGLLALRYLLQAVPVHGEGST